MIFLKTKLTLGSQKYFLPESPSLQMIACCTRRFRSYSTMFSWVFVPLHLRFPSTVDPYENCIHLPFIQSFPVDLVIARCPEILFVVPRILWAYCLAVLCPMNTPLRIIPRTHRGSVHPQLFVWFSKFFEILSDLPKILCNVLLLIFLACLH